MAFTTLSNFKGLMIFSTKALAAAIVLAAASVSHATTYNFSYLFNEGVTMTGSFDGTAAGDLVTGLTNISVTLGGYVYNSSGSLFGSHFESSLGSWVSGGAYASFSGSDNNFLFVDSDYPVDTNYTNHVFSLSQQNVISTLIVGRVSPTSQGMDVTKWHLAAVPEPETYAMLLAGLGLVGTFARRRKAAQA